MKTITAKQYHIMMKKGGLPDDAGLRKAPFNIDFVVNGPCVLCGQEAQGSQPEQLCRGCGKPLTATESYQRIARFNPGYDAVEYRQSLRDCHGVLTEQQVERGIERIGA